MAIKRESDKNCAKLNRWTFSFYLSGRNDLIWPAFEVDLLSRGATTRLSLPRATSSLRGGHGMSFFGRDANRVRQNMNGYGQASEAGRRTTPFQPGRRKAARNCTKESSATRAVHRRNTETTGNRHACRGLVREDERLSITTAGLRE